MRWVFNIETVLFRNTLEGLRLIGCKLRDEGRDVKNHAKMRIDHKFENFEPLCQNSREPYDSTRTGASRWLVFSEDSSPSEVKHPVVRARSLRAILTRLSDKIHQVSENIFLKELHLKPISGIY